jgi:hypothetical protein
MRNFALFSLLFLSICAVAQTSPSIPNPQLPTIGIPQPNIPNPYLYQNQTQQNPQHVDPYNPNEITNRQKRNEALIQEAVEYQRKLDGKSQVQADVHMLATNGFPSQSYQDGTASYYKAFEEINNMLDGKQPLNLGRAVFLVENAYYNNTLNYDDYQKNLNDQVKLCNEKIREDKLDPNNNMVKNMMLFRLISDTLKIKPSGTERIITHLPIKYDLDDYKSEKHYDSHFVTKLMRSGIGQCFSMPLYYLVLAEKMEAKAYWSFSPQHSFVKIQDKNGAWYNIELTCNAILSDAHYMNSSYIKAEAIRNRLYLEPLDKQNTIAELLIQLAGGYYTKYGLDDFYLQCGDTAGKYLKNNLNVVLNSAAYETNLTMTLAHLLDAKKPEVLKQKSPEAYKHYEKMHALYKQIDDMGYEELPEGVYAIWLEHINKLKDKESKQKSLMNSGKK